METSLRSCFSQIFFHCPKNLSCPKFGGAAAPLAPPARTPMRIQAFQTYPVTFLNTFQHLWHVVVQASLSMKQLVIQFQKKLPPNLSRPCGQKFLLQKKNVIWAVLYRQHNSPESFLKYLEETIGKFTSTGKNLCLLGDFNLCLQKIETCNYSRDFLLALQSCYLLPTIDKPTRVQKNSASLIDNSFVNNPKQVLISVNLVTDVSDHFSQFCILTSTRNKIKRKQIKRRELSHFNRDSLNSDLATIDWSCIIKTHANNVDKLFSTFYRNSIKIIGLNNFLSLGLQKV